jgi:hypothetical protein
MTVSFDAGSLGLPDGIKDKPRVDFRVNDFVRVIEAKGYRVAWQRAAPCPCEPLNDQTDQPNPNCSLCGGHGWILFRPAYAVTDERDIGELTTLQAQLAADAAVVRAVMTGITATKQPYQDIGPRLEGQLMVTMRAENKLAYYDRIVNLDAVAVYAQIVTMGDGDTVPLRYPAVHVNLLRSESQIFTEGTDFTVAGGVVTFGAGTVATDTRLVCHYLVHPSWRIIEHPHNVRLTPVTTKTSRPATPSGDPSDLPVQAVAKLEFLL